LETLRLSYRNTEVMIELLLPHLKFENSKFKKTWTFYYLLVTESLINVHPQKLFNAFGKELLKTELLMFMNNVVEELIKYLKPQLQKRLWIT